MAWRDISHSGSEQTRLAKARMRDRKADKLFQRRIQLEQRAWINRRSMTSSEWRLWSELKARQLGVQFRRQVVLAERYIVDFCATTIRLIIEVDGEYHRKRQRYDARRDAKLRDLGYRIVRINAALVMQDLNAATRLVRAAL